jgi:sigma-B regulation protein RsbU (phosphoserine phosphatase)
MSPHTEYIRDLRQQLSETRLLLERRERELAEALESAAHIQRSLIPKQPPNYHHLHYAWRFSPSKKVGGDLFNVAALDEGTIMTYLIDVSGHGLASAMVSVAVQQSLSPTTGRLLKRPLGHRPYYRITSPREVLAELDAEYPFERFDEFFTISYLLINPYTGRVRYGNAGHPPPLLLRGDGSLDRLDCGGPLIGLNHRDDQDEGEAQLYEGDRLFLYTDGLTEQTDVAGNSYGEARLIASLHTRREVSLEQACHQAQAEVQHFAGKSPVEDDMTLIGIEFSRREPASLAT